MAEVTHHPNDSPPAADDKADRFVRLLAANQRRLFLYVMSLVPHWADAEEVLQETNLVLWREFDTFRPGTNFAAWACRVALNQVLAWRKRRQRDRLEFSDAFLEAVAAETEAAADALEDRCEALAGCIAKLPAHHRDMLRLRYGENRGIEAIADQLQRTTEAVYRALSRIRHALHECVNRTLATGS
jgi:RNA polymerase sigma-70 factor (ECF subfamily)